MGFFLTADVEEDVPVVHHDQAVAEAQGVAHVVGDHQGGELLFADDGLGQSEHFLGSLGVEGCGVLVEQQQLWLGHRGHQEGQGLALAAGEQADF